MEIYETKNHFYNLNVHVVHCSKCGKRTVHFAADQLTPICDDCTVPNQEVVGHEQDPWFSAKLHMNATARWFGQSR